MKHIKTLNTQTLNNTVKKGGCGECQTSCQSACKTSCTVGKQGGKAAVYVTAALCMSKTSRGDAHAVKAVRRERHMMKGSM